MDSRAIAWGSIGAGVVLIWSGVQNRTVLSVVRDIISGKRPAVGGTFQKNLTDFDTSAGNTGGGSWLTSGGTLSDRELASVAGLGGFAGNDRVIAVAVALAESGGRTAATNTAGNSAGTDRGLWQINDHYNADLFAGRDWRDPVTNAQMAVSVKSRQGWQAWSVYKSGRYQAFMSRAVRAVGNG